jgi:hypothetical protein
MTEAIAALRQQGAIIVDPANIPSVIDTDPASNFLRWGSCSGADEAKGRDAGCAIGLKYGMKRDFNAWLASLGSAALVRSLTELRGWNKAHARAGTLKYGQSNLDISDEMDVERDRTRYDADRAKDLLLAARHGIDEVMVAERLDAVLFPGAPAPRSRRAWVSDGDCAVRHGAERADAAVSGGVQRQARAVRRQLPGVPAASPGSSSSRTPSSVSHENACRREHTLT